MTVATPLEGGFFVAICGEMIQWMNGPSVALASPEAEGVAALHPGLSRDAYSALHQRQRQSAGARAVQLKGPWAWAVLLIIVGSAAVLLGAPEEVAAQMAKVVVALCAFGVALLASIVAWRRWR